MKKVLCCVTLLLSCKSFACDANFDIGEVCQTVPAFINDGDGNIVKGSDVFANDDEYNAWLAQGNSLLGNPKQNPLPLPNTEELPTSQPEVEPTPEPVAEDPWDRYRAHARKNVVSETTCQRFDSFNECLYEQTTITVAGSGRGGKPVQYTQGCQEFNSFGECKYGTEVKVNSNNGIIEQKSCQEFNSFKECLHEQVTISVPQKNGSVKNYENKCDKFNSFGECQYENKVDFNPRTNCIEETYCHTYDSFGKCKYESKKTTCK